MKNMLFGLFQKENLFGGSPEKEGIILNEDGTFLPNQKFYKKASCT